MTTITREDTVPASVSSSIPNAMREIYLKAVKHSNEKEQEEHEIFQKFLNTAMLCKISIQHQEVVRPMELIQGDIYELLEGSTLDSISCALLENARPGYYSPEDAMDQLIAELKDLAKSVKFIKKAYGCFRLRDVDQEIHP